MIYIQIFLEFFKIGLFSVGGGLATLPFLRQLIDQYGWITHEQLLDMIAISESTPGPIGINTATFVGHIVGGVAGGAAATVGIVAPSIIIIIIIAHYFSKFSENPIVKAGFSGIRPAVAGLIGAVSFEVAKIALLHVEEYKATRNVFAILNVKAVILFSIILYLVSKYKKHPIVYLSAAALVGIVLKL